MVEKIIINPTRVRAYGNIMSPHSSSDYSLEDCTIEAGTDTVNGATETVYTLTPTASHNYSLAFSSSSYTASGGSAEVSVTLTDNSVAVSGATVTFTGGTSTVTATTDSSGVAVATITFSESTTLTASFGGVSDTATITVASYYFYDPVTSDGTSSYTQRIVFGENSPSQDLTPTLTYNSSGYYVFDGNGSDNFAGWEIPNTYGLDDLKIRVTMKLNSTSAYCQCGIGFMTNTYTPSKQRAFFRLRGDNHIDVLDGQVDSAKNTSIQQYNQVRTLEIIRSGGTVTITEYDDSNSQLYTTDYSLVNTYTPSSCYYFFAKNMRNSGTNSYIYEIKAEPI